MALPQALAKWWQDWTEGDRLESCPDREVERMAKDTGVSAAELRCLANMGEDSADLLLQRMAALDLDRNEVSATVPATFQDLQRVCSFCKDHRRCALDLARHRADPAWKDYCPNVGTLLALDAMPWAARKEW
jgi:hypothetical protein